MTCSAPRTVAELQDALRAAGRFAGGVGWWDDPQLRTDEGCTALRPTKGQVELVTFGRGTERVEVFATEEAAVAELARVFLAPAPPVERTPEEREADTIRMQNVAQHALEQIEELKQAGRAQDD